MPSLRPVVLLPACTEMHGEHPYLITGQKYVDAVRLAGALPLIVPWLEVGEIDSVLDLADGVVLTGSPSNVEPTHYGQPMQEVSHPLDPVRDAWTLPLVRRVLQRGLPLLAICRGAQEVNVALGGTLHQALHDRPDKHDHRARHGEPAEVQYGAAHTVQVVDGGLLSGLIGPDPFSVNSLHGQGIDLLADGLRVEALAPDGLVEAFSSTDAQGFNLCVQWHPEWRARDNPVSVRLIAGFGDAVRRYAERNRGHDHDRPSA